MEKNWKFDYEIERFAQAFAEFKEKKIAIYGTGRFTATLIERLQGFNIVGLLDRDENMIGKTVYCVKVLSREEAEKNADILVINTSKTYWNVIYNRIQDWKIPIYFCNGQLAEKTAEIDMENNPYWDKSYDGLRKLTDEYEVVSFDIFDTLVMRKALLPIDVFRLVEMKVQNGSGKKVEFVELRKKAASLLTEPSMEEIYLKMQDITDYPWEKLAEWKQCEIETDRQMIVAREDMVQLCKSVMKQKKVFFVSDMYYSRKDLREILVQNGIEAEDTQILVSCEYGKSKEDGTLWQYYNENIIKGKRALHIGDQEQADYLMPKKFGIDAYNIGSSLKLLEMSSISKILPDVTQVYDSLLLGGIVSKIFNSPFALNETKGKLSFKDFQEAGYCLLGGIVYSFLLFLLRESKKHHVTELVFFAREGYLLIQMYQFMCSLIDESKIPKSKYLEISRRAISVAAIAGEDDIDMIAEFPYKGNFKEFLKARFNFSGVLEDDADLNITDLRKSGTEMQNVLEKYKNKIYNTVQMERRNYLSYWASLNIESNFAIVDSGLQGSTQYYLSKVLGKRIRGFYFNVCLNSDNKFSRFNDMSGCFQREDDQYGTESFLHKYSNFIEAFFTAPYGMVQYIDKNLDKVCAAQGANQRTFQIRERMTEGIKKLLQDLVDIQGENRLELLVDNWEFSDKLFGCFMEEGFIPSKEMKTSFFYDNVLYSNDEFPIWE